LGSVEFDNSKTNIGEYTNFNTGIGSLCGKTGTNNTFFGYKAGFTGNTSGTNNVAVGYNVGLDSTTPGISNTIAIGNNLTATTENEIIFGNSNNWVRFRPSDDGGMELRTNRSANGNFTIDASGNSITLKATNINLDATNINYIDRHFNVNMSTSLSTSVKQTISYKKNTETIIKTSNIIATLDNPSTYKQVYTFGQSIPNRWVAVGQYNNTSNKDTLLYSSDGINWTGLGNSIFDIGVDNTTGVNYTTPQANHAVWNGTIWVAIGYAKTNTIAYSYNGITWNGLGKTIFSKGGGEAGGGLAWNGRMWVAVGEGTHSIAYSYDGINWTGLGSTIFSRGIGVAWNGKMWIAVGVLSSAGKIVYSDNGITWTAASIQPFSSIGINVEWNGNMWVATGEGTHSIAYSYDGNKWTGCGISIFTKGYAVKWNGKMWVAGGEGTNSIAYSYDGINWCGIPGSNNNKMFSNFVTGVCWDGIKWIVCGANTTATDSDGVIGTIAYSSDGINWTKIKSSVNTYYICSVAFNSARPNSIVFPENKMVAIGESSGSVTTSIIATSSNGITWTQSNSGNSMFNSGRDVYWNGTMWVAVGVVGTNSGTNSIAYSYDGDNWTGLGKNIFSTEGNSLAWNGTMWVAVGKGTNSIAYSYDGINWRGLGTSIFSSYGRDVAWNGTMWVAVG
jgi:hypothetical protein